MQSTEMQQNETGKNGETITSPVKSWPTGEEKNPPPSGHKSIIFSQLELAVRIADELTYDDRIGPNWSGHVGYATANERSLVITRSYASPREGANQERLAISIEDGKVCLQGYDERRRHFNIRSPLPLETVLERLANATENGRRAIDSLLFAIRSGDTNQMCDGSE